MKHAEALPLSLLEKDKKWLWHPYTQHALNTELFPVESGSGAYLEWKNEEK